MTKDDLVCGRVYCAKKPRRSLDGFCNDRMLIYVGVRSLQYDSATLLPGRHYPHATVEKFLAWADRDVTAETPDKTWRNWEDRKKLPSKVKNH